MPISESNLTTYLQALSDELVGTGHTYEVLIIGGGVIVALYRFRNVTYDLDVKLLHDSQKGSFFEAAEKVAQRYGLEDDWINAEADKYDHITPEVIADSLDWFDFSALRVLRPSTRALLAMKIEAARIRPGVFDVADAANLLKELDISSLEGAIEVWRHYYPVAVLDELVFRDKTQFLQQAFFLNRTA